MFPRQAARFVLQVLLVVLLLGGAGSASADDAEWRAEWPRYSIAQGVTTGALAATAVVFGLVLEERQMSKWNREVLFDLPFRRLIGARADAGERRAASISDILLTSLIVAPFAVDVGGALVYTRDPDLAGQMALITLQSNTATLALTMMTKFVVGRERPRLADCFAAQLVDPTAPCERRSTVSFFSGHSSMAFTGAGLLCAFGTNVRLYHSDLANLLPCYVGLTAATATALLRVAGNKHYFSDVFVGAAVGLGAGWLLPVLVHFRESVHQPVSTNLEVMPAAWSVPLLGWSSKF